MKAMLLVARRELAERKLIFVVALALGWVPVFAGWLPFSFSSTVKSAQPDLGWFLAACLASLAGIFYGATALPQELRERRLGFYFARPISGGALWWGKTLAGLALVEITAVIAAAPSWVTAPSQISPWIPIFLFGIPFSLMAATQYLATALASRSLLLLGDLGALGIAAGVIWYCLSLFERQGGLASPPPLPPLEWLATLPIALLMAAHGYGLKSGRTAPLRVHSRQSLMLWSLTFPLCFGLVLLTAWAFAGKAEDLRQNLFFTSSPKGSWIVLRGSAHTHGITKAFLVNSQTGQSIQLPLGLSTVTFSEDGRRAVWLDAESVEEQGPSRLFALDLDNPSAGPKETSVVAKFDFHRLVLSPSGRQIAILNGDMVTVNELHSGRIRKIARLPFSARTELNFVGEDLLRILLFPNRGSEREGAIYRLDLVDGTLVQTGSMPHLNSLSGCRPAADGACISFGIGGNDTSVDLLPSWALFDGWTGAKLRDLGNTIFTWSLVTPALGDSRLLFIKRNGKENWLEILSLKGELLRSFPIGKGLFYFAGALAPEKILLTAPHAKQKTVLIDLEQGTVQNFAPGYRPLPLDVFFRQDFQPAPAITPFLSPDNKLIRLDPKTLTFSPIFP